MSLSVASPVHRVLVAGLAGLLTLGSLAWTLDLFRAVGLLLLNEQLMAAGLALAGALTFLTMDLRQRRHQARVPWYDLLASALAFVGIGAVAVTYPTLVEVLLDRPPWLVALCLLIAVLVLEAMRRTVGITLVIVALALFGYAMIGHELSGVLQTRRVSAEALVPYLVLDSGALFGVAMQVVCTIVIGFVFFGHVLERSGGAQFFNDFGMALMGRSRGGPAKIAITTSSLFGSISGVVVSNIVATGVMTIPMMIRAGYSRASAAAVEATASNGGQLVPPVMGAVAFFMAERLQVAYGEVVVAAIIPAALYYLALFLQADLEAARQRIRALDESEIPRTATVMRQGWPLVLPFAVIIGGLFWLNMRAEMAALAGAGTALLIGALRGYGAKRFRGGDLGGAIVETGLSVLNIVMVAAVAGFVIGMLNRSGMSFGMTLALVELGEGNLFILLVVSAVMCVILGMGMPTIGVYLLLSVLVAPPLVKVGVEPMAAHMFIFYLGMMSMVTPPVAIASFFAASLADAKPMATAWASVKFGWTAYIVPFLFVLSPGLLAIGTTWEIVVATAQTALGVVVVSLGVTGYALRALGPASRAGYFVAGGLILIPVGVVGWAPYAAAAGLAAAAALLALDRRRDPAVPGAPAAAPQAGPAPRLKDAAAGEPAG